VEQTAEVGRECIPDSNMVRRLLREHVSELAAQDVRPSPASGSSNWVFRVGERYAVRLPRTDSYADDLLKEARWVPELAPDLPVPVPITVSQGEPSPLFPRPWTVVTWVPGDPPDELDSAGQLLLARELGRFVRALHDLDTHEQVAGAERWGYRCGEPVTDTIDHWARTGAEGLSDLFDPQQVCRAWTRLRDLPSASLPPCWVHTDLSAENLLVDAAGHLSGVIDFGGVGVGDRSVDLLYAWSLFDQPAREELRHASGADESTWMRARAWAFVGPGLLTILGYRHSMPDRTARLIRMVESVAAEVGVSLR